MKETIKRNRYQQFQNEILFLKRDQSNKHYSNVGKFYRISRIKYIMLRYLAKNKSVNKKQFINDYFLKELNDHLKFIKRLEAGKYQGSTSRFLEDRNQLKRKNNG